MIIPSIPDIKTCKKNGNKYRLSALRNDIIQIRNIYMYILFYFVTKVAQTTNLRKYQNINIYLRPNRTLCQIKDVI